MHVLRCLQACLKEFFYRHYPYISLCSCLMALITAYLHYEWKVHSYDLMSWQRLVASCCSFTDLDVFQFSVLVIILLINIIFVRLIIAAYARPLSPRDSELTLLEIKDRYARFILLRLVARLDRIQGKLAAKRKTLSVQHFARAHHSMVKAVAVFRKDARKLILPNESEIMQPIEDIYGVAEDEERALRHDGYFKLPIDITDAIVKSLFTAH
ncbi:uncharacterized protein LOC6558968 [Drosophila grimshawi]|uniref:GH15304 n=1 Tax=Drosophila grimshawi TaxID=7222 RepID=B4IWN9_DROGR|nr:uncharacterized protein LOC6558968 [Drosophila grimshawi]EDV96265.1 GH15304 [Drosophila grimshawi]